MFQRLKDKIKSKLIREIIKPVFISDVPNKLLLNKTALVSGGSSGIGLGIAKKMSESGCKVIVMGRNENKLKQVSADIKGDYVVIDISNIKELETRIGELLKDTRIDILVNSAGINGNDKFGHITEDGWNEVINVNVRGLYFLSQYIANHMIEQHINGHILNISSASSLKPSWTPYEISKRSVDGITRGMAHKLIQHGIVVNGLAPGPTATPMLKFDKPEDINLKWPGNPSGRMSTVEEIANLSIFMVSSLGDGIVGDTFFMTGGSGTVCIDK